MTRILLLTILTTVPVFAAKSNSMVICKSNKVVRTLAVNADPAKGCITTYSKDGSDKVVGEARFEASCKKISDNIRRNLESASWKCKDVPKFQISHSEKKPE